MKQYFVYFEADPPRYDIELPDNEFRATCRAWDWRTGDFNPWDCDQILFDPGANYSTIKGAKSYISKAKRVHKSQNPRNFMIFDQWALEDGKSFDEALVYKAQ